MNRCKLAAIAEGLSGSDRAALLFALEQGAAHSDIAAVLTRHGHDISEAAIRRHRKDGHRCSLATI